jgi:L-lactate dehydrogenase (cytochrome)
VRLSYPYQAIAFSDVLECSLGPVDLSTVAKVEVRITDEEKARLKNVEARPPLSEILNLHDFEVNIAYLKDR